MIDLNVKERDTKQKPAALRTQGIIPAVVYGPQEDTSSIAIDAPTFERVWKETGASAIINLKGVGEDKEVLIHDVQRHPVSGAVIHIDFYAIERGKKLEVSIPIEFIGEAPAEKTGGVILKILHEVEISVRPSELPQHLEIDLSSLENIGDHITVSEIKLPESGEFITDPEEAVVSVKEQKIEKEPEPEVEAPAEGEEAPEGSEEAQAEEGEAEGGDEKGE